VPGDYLYFKNKDDYLKWAPTGFWQGLNSMYMGTDALGTKHYSGLGAAWLSEFNLRAIVVNAYTHDCYPHQVDDPETEVRFTVQATMHLPDDSAKPLDDHTKELTAMTPTHDQLVAAGFTQHPDDADLYEREPSTLAEVAQQLGFDPGDLSQTVSAPAFGASHQIDLGSARLIVSPKSDGEATDADSDVVTHVRLHASAGDGSEA
jgi:hypothetical protein